MICRAQEWGTYCQMPIISGQLYANRVGVDAHRATYTHDAQEQYGLVKVYAHCHSVTPQK